MSERSIAQTVKPSGSATAPAFTGILQRQCACGQHAINGECEGCRKNRLSKPVQAKLLVPRASDASESAADRASAAVMAGRPVPSAALALHGPPAGVHVPSNLTERVEKLEGSGRPLSESEREFFESRFDRDLSHVRVHHEHPSYELARSLGANAFTYGRNIAFRPGAYAPGSQSGRSLLAHELAHVIQQGAGKARSAGLVQRSVYDAIKEKVYGGIISGLRTAKNATMNALRARVPRLPGQYQGAAYTVINIMETVIEIDFSILYAVIGMIVGFGEGIVDMVKGLATLIYGALKVTTDLVVGIFTSFDDLKADVDAIISALQSLPGALKKIVTDWIDKFSKAPTERQSLMIGELTGQVLALIATYAISVTRAGSAARVAAGSTEVIDAAAETTAKVTSTGAKASAIAADAGTTSAKAASTTADVASTGAKATGTAADAGKATNAAKPALRAISGGRASSTGAKAASSATKTASAASKTASTAAQILPKTIPRAYSAGGNALRYAPEAEEAAAASSKQPILRALPTPPPDPLPIPEILEPPLPAAVPPGLAPAVAAPAVVAKAGTATKVAVAATEATAVATQAATKAKKKKKKEKDCNNEDPCGVLPVIWPHELPPPTDARPMKRTSGGQREAEGIDRGPNQQRFANCLTRARENGQDYVEACAHLGGDWFDPDLLHGEPADAHHMHPLYLGGEDSPYNLGAVEHDRHMLGHKLLNNQHVMFATDPTWEQCRVCSPLLTRHPIDQEYEIETGME